MIVCSMVPLGIISASALLFYSRVYKEYFHAEKLFCQGFYKEVNKYVAEHPTTNRLTIYLNNIAVANRKANDRFFYFPQSPDGQSFP